VWVLCSNDHVDAIELPRPVAFVLGGGGSLGAAQAGMLRALAERGIRPDLVIGTSVGSVNGSLLALDPDNAPGRLDEVWRRMTRQKVFPGGPLAQLTTLRKYKNYLFPNNGLAEILATELLGVDDFSHLTLPFGAVAVDAMTGQAVLIDNGPLTPAILASAAIPGIYPPVHHQGRTLYDGGVGVRDRVQQRAHPVPARRRGAEPDTPRLQPHGRADLHRLRQLQGLPRRRQRHRTGALHLT
jgi:NTE family protein